MQCNEMYGGGVAELLCNAQRTAHTAHRTRLKYQQHGLSARLNTWRVGQSFRCQNAKEIEKDMA